VREHWNKAYAEKGEAGVSWFEAVPETSLALIRTLDSSPGASMIDIGGGASRLVDALVEAGGLAITVLDLSGEALAKARDRLGERGEAVEWIEADVTTWMPVRQYDIWHDRAAFHFLVEPGKRAAYVARAAEALVPGGNLVIATFAPDGPERCSGLPVMRYDAQGLANVFRDHFEPVDALRHVHQTPWGATQSFQYAVLRRTGR